MQAMMLNKLCVLEPGDEPLELVALPIPKPQKNEILLKVAACAICHTELDEIEGRTPPSHLPIVLGHQVVGRVQAVGNDVRKYEFNDRVGVAWIYSACGQCLFCRSGKENLCEKFQATGRDKNGGYAQYMVVPENFAYKIPSVFSDVQAAPLLCAGAIGYRSIKLSKLKDGQHLGLTGFGASAHLVLKMVKHQYPNSPVYVFARKQEERDFAIELGAQWAGATEDESPRKLTAIIDTTPAWKPVVQALSNLERGGRLIINAIRKEERDKSVLMQLDYAKHLWQEKEVKSVANVARSDVQAFLALAASIPLLPHVETYNLAEVNKALIALKFEKVRGAKVIIFEQD